MGKRGNIVRELKEKHDPYIIERERGKCFICKSKGRDVHEVLSKSHFSTNDLDQCISPMNMVLLCRKHHDLVQGIAGWMGYLFREMHSRYGYDYTHTDFYWYYINEFPDNVMEIYVK